MDENIKGLICLLICPFGNRTEKVGLIVLIRIYFFCYGCNFFLTKGRFAWLQQFKFTDK